MATTHKAVVLSDFSRPIEVKEQSIPTATSGSVVVKVSALYLLDYTKKVLNGELGYPLHLPMTPGGSCVGRIHAVGPDTTSLKVGQLVITDSTIAARDDPSVQFLLGIHAGATSVAQGLNAGEWRNGSLAEYVRMPLENVYPLDEDALVEKHGYSIDDLPLLQTIMIPYGGLADARVQSGDTVIVAPATGKFGGAAVLAALSMGTKVVACGRSVEGLAKLRKSMEQVSNGRLQTVAWAGDDDDATLLRSVVGSAGVDVYIDFSPPAAGANGQTPAHMLHCIASLKNSGTCVLMGGLTGSITLPHMLLMFNNIVVRGNFMYTRDQARQVIKMAENGILKLGKVVGQNVEAFELESIHSALERAAELPGWGVSVVVTL